MGESRPPVTVFDRYPEQTAQLEKLGDLFGKAGRIHLAQLKVSPIDRVQIDRGKSTSKDAIKNTGRKRTPKQIEQTAKAPLPADDEMADYSA